MPLSIVNEFCDSLIVVWDGLWNNEIIHLPDIFTERYQRRHGISNVKTKDSFDFGLWKNTLSLSVTKCFNTSILFFIDNKKYENFNRYQTSKLFCRNNR